MKGLKVSLTMCVIMLAIMPAAYACDFHGGYEIRVSGHKVVVEAGQKYSLKVDGKVAKMVPEGKMLRIVLNGGLKIALSGTGLNKGEYDLDAEYQNGNRLTVEMRQHADKTPKGSMTQLGKKAVTACQFRDEGGKRFKYFCQMTGVKESPSIRIIELTRSSKVSTELRQAVATFKIRRAK